MAESTTRIPPAGAPPPASRPGRPGRPGGPERRGRGRPAGSGVRERLIDAGLRVIYRAGYTGAGISDVVAGAGVPKGSFYNYFDSKEAFAAAVVDRFADWNLGRLVAALGDRRRTPLTRLRTYFAERRRALAEHGHGRGCLLANLGAETADVVGVVRERLAARFAEWQRVVAGCLREARELGELSPAADVDALAAFVIHSWEGALIRMKVDRSAAPLATFDHFVFDVLLTESR